MRVLEEFDASGCISVEMECLAMAALARFREREVFQFFYAADNLDGETWDIRSLDNGARLDDKDRIAGLAMELAVRVAGVKGKNSMGLSDKTTR